MKKLILTLFFCTTSSIFAQVGVGTTTPQGALDIATTAGSPDGLLIPRVALVNTTTATVATPTTSEIVYNTATAGDVTPGFYYWNGTAWIRIATGTDAGWSLTGNTGNILGTNFLGNRDNNPLEFRVFNTRSGYICDNTAATNHNTFFGFSSGNAFTSGISNTGVGKNALALNTTGSRNTAIGALALQSNTTSTDLTVVGYNALGVTNSGDNITVVGSNSLTQGNSGKNLVVIGDNNFFNRESPLILAINSGNNLTSIGSESFYKGNSGSDNTAVGAFCFRNNLTGDSNTAVGATVLNFNTSGQNNTAIGKGAMYGNYTGVDNTAIGFNSLSNSQPAAGPNKGNRDNTAVGSQALQSNFGDYNVGIGKYSLQQNTEGYENVAVGSIAGLANQTGFDNVFIGHKADASANNFYNGVAIGFLSTLNANNKVRLGGTGVTVVEGQVAYSLPSDARFKKNIKENVPGLDFIKQLRPVTYTFDTKKFDEHLRQNSISESDKKNNSSAKNYEESSAIVHTGFLAQDIETSCKRLNYNFDGLHTPDANNKTDHYSVAYSQFIMPLVKAVQEQQTIIEKVTQENQQLKQEMAAMNAKIDLLLKKK